MPHWKLASEAVNPLAVEGREGSVLLNSCSTQPHLARPPQLQRLVRQAQSLDPG